MSNKINTKLHFPQSFGAVGDGVEDDTVAIQAAITCANSSGGGIVFFPAGTYLVSATINLLSNVYLMGAGVSSCSITRASDYGNTFAGDGVTYFGVYDIQMTSTVATNSGAHIFLDHCNNFQLDRTNLYHLFGGLWIQGGGSFFITNLLIQSAIDYGSVKANSYYIRFSKAASGNIAPANIVIDNFSLNASNKYIEYGILIQSSDGLQLSNGYIGQCDNGVMLAPNAVGDQISGVDINSSWIEGQTDYSICTSGASTGISGLHRFYNLRCYGHGACDYGIRLGNTGESDIEVSNCEVSGYLYEGIVAATSGGIKIHNCGITRNSQTTTNTRSGIGIDADIDNVSIKGCDFGFVCPASGNTAHAYHINISAGNGDYIHIANNTYKNAGTANLLNNATGVNNIIETPTASGGALAAYGAGANGLDSGANMQALHALVVAMRAALVAHGIMT